MEMTAPEGWLILNQDFGKRAQEAGEQIVSKGVDKPLADSIKTATEQTSILFSMIRRPVPNSASVAMLSFLIERAFGCNRQHGTRIHTKHEKLHARYISEASRRCTNT